MQVHRFRNRVAIHLNEGPTHYLSPKAARALGSALTEAARDVKAGPYLESNLKTEHFDRDMGSRPARRMGPGDVMTADEWSKAPDLDK